MLKQSLSLALVFAAGSAIAQEARPSFTLAPIQTEATVSSASLRELDPVGLGQQPAWSSGGNPRFTFSDVYAINAGARAAGVYVGTDFGFRGENNIHTDVAEQFTVGLKYGWQVAVAFTQDLNNSGDHGDSRDYLTLGGKIEVKKAIAPWGRLWGNPTLSLSFAEREGNADALRFAVLLGDNFAERWTWVGNIAYTHGFDDADSKSVALTGGAMYSIIDSKLAVGVEAVAQWQKSGNSDDGAIISAGPSVQWAPTVFGRSINVNAAFLPLGVRAEGWEQQNRFAAGVTYAF